MRVQIGCADRVCNHRIPLLAIRGLDRIALDMERRVALGRQQVAGYGVNADRTEAIPNRRRIFAGDERLALHKFSPACAALSEGEAKFSARYRNKPQNSADPT
jgi:hypothetical protein